MCMSDSIRTVWNKPEWISLYANLRPIPRISAIIPTVLILLPELPVVLFWDITMAGMT